MVDGDISIRQNIISALDSFDRNIVNRIRGADHIINAIKRNVHLFAGETLLKLRNNVLMMGSISNNDVGEINNILQSYQVQLQQLQQM